MKLTKKDIEKIAGEMGETEFDKDGFIITPLIPAGLTKRIVSAMKKTWDACGMDFIQLTQEYEGRSYCDFDEVSECVIDANRMEMFGNDKEATDFFYALGYTPEEEKEKTRILKIAFPEKRFGR